MRGRDAFSFVEILIVMAVIASLSIMALEFHGRHGRSCRVVKDRGDRRRLESARLLWSFDHDGRSRPSDAALEGLYLVPGREPLRKEFDR